MLILSVVSLAVASISTFLTLSVEEEVMKVAFTCTAIFAVLLTLFCAPWTLKLTLLAIPFLFERLYRFSAR